ncbi:hypothetical protein [Halobaculum rubrum]|uniref:hypothetical protein n=1 Tax=Halobaculum rubrum TaxID=2872158 RepID=UPI001CA3DB86|nr:hypothetical protein [Halobaculum rubrum]QZX99795.1 hypothetical protein K6T25_01410 [Halobaculum rubrum]QZX99832.1 hypothetical protein K6T25_01605 [Halobaculum rubrum]
MTMTARESLINLVSDNLRTIIAVGGGYVLAVEMDVIDAGYPSVPSLPGWWTLGALAFLGTLLVAWMVGDKIADLLPDPPGHIIVALDETTDMGLGAWELNDRAWEELDVHEGTLYPWTDSPLDTYEARIYNPEANAAVANWREAAPASRVLGETEESAVRAMVGELRDQYEEDARHARALRRRIPSILRRLDARRATDQNAALEPHLSPSFGDETIDDVIAEELPAESLPSHLAPDDDGTGDDLDDDENGEMFSLDLLEDDEALEPTGSIANDGGRVE